MENVKYKAHIFICTNIKKEGKCCGNDQASYRFIKELKDLVRSLELTGKDGIRVSSSGCMGMCQEGPVVVIYPEGYWFNLNNPAHCKYIYEYINQIKSLSIS